MSFTWPCCGNLASAAVWRDLVILKSADAHLVSGGWKQKIVLSGRCMAGLGAVCVSICLYVYKSRVNRQKKTKKKTSVQCIQVMA